MPERFKALGKAPLLVAPVIICPLLMMKFAQRWSVRAALFVALAVVGIHLAVNGAGFPQDTLLPALGWTTPSFSPDALVGVAVPLLS